MGRINTLILMLLLALTAQAQQKREFRGAWIQCVNGQFKGIGTQVMQRTLSYQLDESFPDSSVLEVAKIKKDGGAWTLEALGNGSSDLATELKKYHIPC
jgi:stress response protein SCP2